MFLVNLASLNLQDNTSIKYVAFNPKSLNIH